MAYNTKTFIEKVENIHQFKYDYSLVNFVNVKLKITIVCPKEGHGPFEQTPDAHIQGSGCPACKLKYHYDFSCIASENAISCYLLGAFITDGCIHASNTRLHMRSLSLDSQDYDWLELVRDLICPELKIKKDRTCYRLFFNQIKFVDWFINRGIVPRKSLITTIPNIPVEFLPDFIRGCIDGDGCIGNYKNTSTNQQGKTYTYDKPETYICSASKVFIDDLAKAVSNAGFLCSTTARKQTISYIGGRKIIPRPNSMLYKIRFSCRGANDFLQWAYYPEHKISMPRKMKLAESIRSVYERKDS